MSCENNATCDFCDARCDAYIFDFTEDWTKDEFEKDFLSWYDCGKPISNIKAVGYDTVSQAIFEEYWNQFVDIIEGDENRWYRWIEKIIRIENRFFSIGYCQRGLTEYQENIYDDADIVEVVPKEKTITVIDWECKE